VSADSVAVPAPRGTGATESPATKPADSTVPALDGEGLRAVATSTGSTTPIPFGTRRERVMTAMTALRHAPDEQGVNPECGAGPLEFATWHDGLRLWFSDGRFVGWGVDGRAEGSGSDTTLAGIGTGSTLVELRDVYTTRVDETSLGVEFDAGGLHGVLSGTGPSARVTHLWAGTVCIVR
jgi:hypothetical protein